MRKSLAGAVALLAAGAAAKFGDKEREHMRKVHAIDNYDQGSFFVLHDTNANKYLDSVELMHFYTSYSDSKDESGAKEWLSNVMDGVDLNKDGRLSFEEYRRPAFEDRVFSGRGSGDGLPPLGGVATSSWTETKPIIQDGKRVYEYHNVPQMFRVG